MIVSYRIVSYGTVVVSCLCLVFALWILICLPMCVCFCLYLHFTNFSLLLSVGFLELDQWIDAKVRNCRMTSTFCYTDKWDIMGISSRSEHPRPAHTLYVDFGFYCHHSFDSKKRRSPAEFVLTARLFQIINRMSPVRTVLSRTRVQPGEF